jgi:hypothetical protein
MAETIQYFQPIRRTYGADSFQRGHIIERLAQDVRALDLFSGRTEALRAAVAEDPFPRIWT